jgi:hypothetical protein
MYLIGFLGSPLPYILLVGMYLSGFAFLNLKTGTRVSDEKIRSEDLTPVTTYVSPGNMNDLNPDQCILNKHHERNSSLSSTSRGHNQVAIMSQNFFQQRPPVIVGKIPLVNSFSIVLYYPSQNTIRPPPVC